MACEPVHNPVWFIGTTLQPGADAVRVDFGGPIKLEDVPGMLYAIAEAIENGEAVVNDVPGLKPHPEET